MNNGEEPIGRVEADRGLLGISVVKAIMIWDGIQTKIKRI